jgi:threonine/homoserine efflux transporter RhtA
VSQVASRRSRWIGWVLVALAVFLLLLTLGLAFTSYGIIAAVLAAPCLALGIFQLTRDE